MNEKKELEIYRSLLINLHTYAWTGNNKKFQEIMEAIGRYSYARTNSNPGNEEQEECEQLSTLKKLGKLVYIN